jgi:hypothetical protein
VAGEPAREYAPSAEFSVCTASTHLGGSTDGVVPLCRIRAGGVPRRGGVDLIRESVRLVVQELIQTEASRQISASRDERTDTRVTDRNGSRLRLLATQAGDVQLRIPKLRDPAEAGGASDDTSPLWSIAPCSTTSPYQPSPCPSQQNPPLLDERPQTTPPSSGSSAPSWPTCTSGKSATAATSPTGDGVAQTTSDTEPVAAMPLGD